MVPVVITLAEDKHRGGSRAKSGILSIVRGWERGGGGILMSRLAVVI